MDTIEEDTDPEKVLCTVDYYIREFERIFNFLSLLHRPAESL